jgi:hypothetical protein
MMTSISAAAAAAAARRWSLVFGGGKRRVIKGRVGKKEKNIHHFIGDLYRGLSVYQSVSHCSSN